MIYPNKHSNKNLTFNWVPKCQVVGEIQRPFVDKRREGGRPYLYAD